MEIVKAVVRGLDGFEGFLLGSSLAYHLRGTRKGQFDSDVRKAEDFLRYLMEYRHERDDETVRPAEG